jgi:hypothetical protein
VSRRQPAASRRAGNDREGGEDRRRPDTRIRWSGDPGAGDHPPPVHRSTQEPRGPRGRWPALRRSPESFGPAGIGRHVTGGGCPGDPGSVAPWPAACMPPACRGCDADRCRHRQVRSRLRRELSRAARTSIVPPQRAQSSGSTSYTFRMRLRRELSRAAGPGAAHLQRCPVVCSVSETLGCPRRRAWPPAGRGQRDPSQRG